MQSATALGACDLPASFKWVIASVPDLRLNDGAEQIMPSLYGLRQYLALVKKEEFCHHRHARRRTSSCIVPFACGSEGI